MRVTLPALWIPGSLPEQLTKLISNHALGVLSLPMWDTVRGLTEAGLRKQNFRFHPLADDSDGVLGCGCRRRSQVATRWGAQAGSGSPAGRQRASNSWFSGAFAGGGVPGFVEALLGLISGFLGTVLQNAWMATCLLIGHRRLHALLQREGPFSMLCCSSPTSDPGFAEELGRIWRNLLPQTLCMMREHDLK